MAVLFVTVALSTLTSGCAVLGIGLEGSSEQGIRDPDGQLEVPTAAPDNVMSIILTTGPATRADYLALQNPFIWVASGSHVDNNGEWQQKPFVRTGLAMGPNSAMIFTSASACKFLEDKYIFRTQEGANTGVAPGDKEEGKTLPYLNLVFNQNRNFVYSFQFGDDAGPTGIHPRAQFFYHPGVNENRTNIDPSNDQCLISLPRTFNDFATLKTAKGDAWPALNLVPVFVKRFDPDNSLQPQHAEALIEQPYFFSGAGLFNPGDPQNDVIYALNNNFTIATARRSVPWILKTIGARKDNFMRRYLVENNVSAFVKYVQDLSGYRYLSVYSYGDFDIKAQPDTIRYAAEGCYDFFPATFAGETDLGGPLLREVKDSAGKTLNLELTAVFARNKCRPLAYDFSGAPNGVADDVARFVQWALVTCAGNLMVVTGDGEHQDYVSDLKFQLDHNEGRDVSSYLSCVSEFSPIYPRRNYEAFDILLCSEHGQERCEPNE